MAVFRNFGQVVANVWDTVNSAFRVSLVGGSVTIDNATVNIGAPATAGGQGSKNVAIAATPVALAASTACTTVQISARVNNAGQIAYGFSNTVRATVGSEIGACLQAGDSVTLSVENLDVIWLDAQVSGDGVSFTYTAD